MKSIRQKLNLFVSSTVLFSIIIVSGIGLWTFYNSTIDQGIESYSMLADGYKQAVDNKIHTLKKQLEMVAKQNDITSDTLTMDEKGALLARYAENSGFSYISVANSTGQTYRSSDISDREYFQQALSRTDYMSDPVINKVDGKLTVMLGVPVQNDTDFTGIVYAGIPYEDFISELISNISIGEAGYAFIVNKSGTIVASPDLSAVEDGINYIAQAEQDDSYQSAAKIVSNMVAGETGTDFMTYEGRRWLIAYSPLSGPEGDSIALIVPMSQVLKDFIYSAKQSVAFCIILTIVALVCSTILSGRIVLPIKRAVKRIISLSEGDLTTEVELIRGKDEIAELAKALKATILQLRAYIGDINFTLTSMSHGNFNVESKEEYHGDFVKIKESLTCVLTSLRQTLGVFNESTQRFDKEAKQMVDTSQILAQGASEQANSVEELSSTVTSALEEVCQNYQNASEAKAFASQARNILESGTQQMNLMVQAMNDINASSAEISKVIKVINDIAFQTNILALNAAVEATRAGQAGKSFAVVAEEVRNLASKCAKSAKTTTTLIESSNKKIVEGTGIADATAESMRQIVTSMNQIAGLIEKIDAASARQKESLEQVELGTNQISAVIQTNSATAEESSGLGRELSEQATTLRNELSRFRI